MKRLIDKIKGKEKGKEVIIIAGMHGNELAGVRAVKKVMNYIKKNNLSVKGNITALYGNMKAVKKELRFIDKDLNRLWTKEHLSKDFKKSEIYELKELQELNKAIEDICNNDYANCVMLDFHSFTAASGIFAIPADNQKSIDLAKQFGVQFIEQLTSDLQETAIQYFAFKGATAVVFEGGQHYSEETEPNIKAAAFIALSHSGNIHSSEVSQFDEYVKTLKEKAAGLPTHYKLSYIHRIKNRNDFEMKKGYINFQEIEKGELLAHENGKPVTAKCKGRMLMPLYQKKGNNGFYIIKEI